MEEHTTASVDPALTSAALDRLSLEVQGLRQELFEGESKLADAIAAVHPENLPSARNLAHYLALRRHDIRALQLRLARVGLSSLGQSEAHVLVTIDSIIAMLALARGTTRPDPSPVPVGFLEGGRVLAANTRRLLGPVPPRRGVRVVVTLPPETAEDPQRAHDLVVAGMDCARINCGRDDASVWTAMAKNVRAARKALGCDCKILVDLGGPKIRTGAIAGGPEYLLLSAGDRLELVADERLLTGGEKSLPRVVCTPADIFQDVEASQPIWFDDGKIGGIIEECQDDALLIRVTRAKAEGAKLRSERGINLPDSRLSLSAPTDKDLRDLAEVIPWADAIGMSFVQRPEDVLKLHEALRGHGADHIGVVLKIETRLGFENLPLLLLAAMRRRSCGVMIARGDLAVEVGFERMVEVQEEILWIAEAAHLPTIWATQVLDDLVKEGTLSRAEVTDAAMSARAEAVMLNKGPFVIDAIRTLDDILGRMQEHHSKKRSLFGALRVSGNLWT